MKKVFIKYNPYKIETEITVEGKKLAENSNLGEKIVSGSRLQEWVEELPQILIEEYNDNDFEIVFHGTLLDFEDLIEVFTQAYEKGELTAKLDRKPAKETRDKEMLIDQVFQKIQEGPFEDLKSADVINAFENAKSSDFEVCVVATMSSGKSTLINSLLRTKLMPSKQEACTAIITKIKDNDAPVWQAEVYGKDNRLIETHEELTYSTMERLNDDKRVSTIKVIGNIPFVTSEDTSLILIDTPGPNNSRDPEHNKVQSEFLNKSSKSLILYIMEGTFGSDDDNKLLERVAESMSVGGKQSKDRFIFVVNKMDDRKKEDGDTEQTLTRIRNYLKKHGIVNPSLFPAAALPALNIRMIESGIEVDEDTIDETEVKVKKLNRNENLHFEGHASLPKSIKNEINRQLKEAEESEDVTGQALIHTGIVSIEAAIKQYMQKYAKTAKIKNVVDTFIHRLGQADYEERMKKDLAEKQDDVKDIVKNIEDAKKKLADGKEAQKFQNNIDSEVKEVNNKSIGIVEGIVEKFEDKIGRKIDEFRGKELSIEEAESTMQQLGKFAKKLEPDFETELNNMIKKNLIDSSQALLESYKRKLSSLMDDELGKTNVITIDSLKLIGGDISFLNSFSPEYFVQTKEVENGEEWIKNTEKKWYKPWTWFQEEGYYRTKYKTVQYIDAGEIADEFFSQVEEIMHKNKDNAIKHALQQSRKILEIFAQEFKKLDNLLKKKLNELESYATDKEKAEARVREAEEKLKWLEQIKNEVESILEI